MPRMKPETKIRKMEKQIAQIRNALEYEYDYFRVKELREESDRLQRQIERLRKCKV